jgi:hypothetical protein
LAIGPKLRAALRVLPGTAARAAGTPDEYAANIVREEGKWADVIKKLGIKIE